MKEDIEDLRDMGSQNALQVAAREREGRKDACLGIFVLVDPARPFSDCISG